MVGVEVPDTPRLAARGAARRRTRSSTRCWPGARPSGSRPRTATAGSTSTSGADGRLPRRVVGVRRRGRAHDGVGRAAQHARRHARRAWSPSRATCSCGPTSARSSRGSSPRCRGDPLAGRGHAGRRPLRAGRRPARRRPGHGQGRGARRHVRPDHGPRAPGPCAGSTRRTRWPWPTWTPPTGPARSGADLRTYGGRLVRMGSAALGEPVSAGRATARPARRAAARGRYGRNAMVQGAAAELFKVWAVTVRARGAALGATRRALPPRRAARPRPRPSTATPRRALRRRRPAGGRGPLGARPVRPLPRRHHHHPHLGRSQGLTPPRPAPPAQLPVMTRTNGRAVTGSSWVWRR